jgi:hypothetical protein
MIDPADFNHQHRLSKPRGNYFHFNRFPLHFALELETCKFLSLREMLRGRKASHALRTACLVLASMPQLPA